MRDVVIGLMPAVCASLYCYGWDAARLLSVCLLACLGTEVICRKAMGRDTGIEDLSAVVTAIILALSLPPSLPTWMTIVGAVSAIAIGKQIYGGLGYNPFNPAMVGRVVLLISFTGPMTIWHSPRSTDATTTATPLGMLREAGSYTFDSAIAKQFFLGDMSGSIGEVSALALLLGGLYLAYKRAITWHAPVCFVATVAIFASILYAIDSEQYAPPHFHILTGGLMIGAIFIATDMVTTPATLKGMAIFGIGCGIFTMVIRTWGGYPEGVSFSILLMNSVTPLINRATVPRVFGH